MITIRVAFGKELVDYIFDNNIDIWTLSPGLQDPFGEIKELVFNNMNEVNAYMQGFSDMDGWNGFYTSIQN